MLKERPQTQSSLEFVSIDELVPSDHLLRKTDRTIDFSFLPDLVKDFYCADIDHRTVDAHCNIITDVYVMFGKAAQNMKKDRLDVQLEGKLSFISPNMVNKTSSEAPKRFRMREEATQAS